MIEDVTGTGGLSLWTRMQGLILGGAHGVEWHQPTSVGLAGDFSRYPSLLPIKTVLTGLTPSGSFIFLFLPFLELV